MILGIDASNLRDGGGVTHLVELLRAAVPLAYGFSQVVIWGAGRLWSASTTAPGWRKATSHRWKRVCPIASFGNGSGSPNWLGSSGCRLLFAPGGLYAGDFHPVVTMSRNMLPFRMARVAAVSGGLGSG